MEAKLKKVGVVPKHLVNKMRNVYQQKPSPQVVQKKAATANFIPQLEGKVTEMEEIRCNFQAYGR